jgi:hypothetical protein
MLSSLVDGYGSSDDSDASGTEEDKHSIATGKEPSPKSMPANQMHKPAPSAPGFTCRCPHAASFNFPVIFPFACLLG